MKKKSFGDTIKKLVEASQEKRLKEFESQINKAVEKKIEKAKNDILSRLSDEKKYPQIKDAMSKNNELLEKANAEIELLKKKLEETKDTEELLKRANLKDVSRNIEILRTRSQWLENRLENYNIKPIMDKIHELEVKIDSIKLSSPLVVE